MFDISRRRFVVGASTAAAVFGLNGKMEFLPSALAQGRGKDQQNPAGKAFHRFKIGDIEVTQVFDGETPRPIKGFVKNASDDDVKKALQKAGFAGNDIPVPYTMTFVRAGGVLTMFDSGNAPAGMPAVGRHLAGMKAAGIEPKDVKRVIVTHFHPDHIFGLYAEGNNPMYPEAEIIVPAAELNFWTDASKLAKLPERLQGLGKRVSGTIAKWKNVRRFEGEGEVAPGIRPVATYGHTPGHTSFHVASGSAQMMVLGDVTNVLQLFVPNPGWHVMFDMNAAAAEATRRKTFDRVVADKIVVAGYHWGMPGCGTLAKDGNGYAFTPQA
ncbi:MAG: MBL fold metallo-hydrolase [Beijerinckiaceae bacterium]